MSEFVSGVWIDRGWTLPDVFYRVSAENGPMCDFEDVNEARDFLWDLAKNYERVGVKVYPKEFEK